MNFKKYIKVWWILSRNSFVTVLYARIALFIFLLGKSVRFIFFLGFLHFLLQSSNTLGGYSSNQIIFFFLTFNLMDIFSQFLYREVYRFRSQIITVSFDITLSKPFSALFRSLMGGADVIDLITIPPLLVLMVIVGKSFNPTVLQVISYVVLFINGFIISTAFHILVMSLGIITMEVDNLIMIYRDFLALGRIPVDVYKFPLNIFLTYLVPVGIMLTVPAKSFFGLVSIWGILASFVLAFLSIFMSLKFWKYSLKRYTSASS